MRIVVIQDHKENRRKCTLTPLERRADIVFRRLGPPCHGEEMALFGPGILLSLDGPLLTAADARFVEGEGQLLLLDATWARLPSVQRRVAWVGVELRSLPSWVRTAYPRISKVREDPAGGLASIEALFAATAILGLPQPDLLRGYRWTEEFLELNQELLLATAVGPEVSCGRSK